MDVLLDQLRGKDSQKTALLEEVASLENELFKTEASEDENKSEIIKELEKKLIEKRDEVNDVQQQIRDIGQQMLEMKTPIEKQNEAESPAETYDSVVVSPVTASEEEPVAIEEVEPVAVAVEEVAEPVEEVAEPVQKVAEPVEEVAESVQKVAVPVEEVAEPVQKVAVPVEEVAEPVKVVAEEKFVDENAGFEKEKSTPVKKEKKVLPRKKTTNGKASPKKKATNKTATSDVVSTFSFKNILSNAFHYGQVGLMRGLQHKSFFLFGICSFGIYMYGDYASI